MSTLAAYHERVHAQQLAAAADLGVDLVPGTEIEASTEHAHFVTSGKQVLIPQPDPSPHDPLNYSRLWKYGIMLNQAIFVIATNLPALGIAPIVPFFIQEWNISQDRASLYIGVCVITLGYFNFVLVPLANVYGRRFVILAGGVLVAASLVWSAVAKSDASFIASRAITGIGAAANESVMGMIVADIFFLHQRGSLMGIYFFSYFTGITVGPIVAGNAAAAYGWRMFFWICLALVCFSVVLTAVALPETRWQRLSVSSGAGTPPSQDHKSLESSEKRVNEHHDQAEPESEPAASFIGKGHPARGQFRLIQKADPNAVKHIWSDIITPVKLFFNPIVWWASFNLGFAANSLLAFNILESAVLGGPPYNFLPGAVGTANVAFFIGGVIGCLTAGPFSDWVSAKMTRRNNSVREPEFRLIALIPFSLIAVFGMTIIAVAITKQWPWEVIVILGFFCVGIQMVAIPAISLTYAVDCYKPVSGEILAIATVCKNTVGFSETYWIPPLMIERGFALPIYIMMALCIFFMGLTIPMYFYGKALRRWTRNSPLHTMNQG